ncbi:MAG: 50S ribosomal protein L23 [Methylobacter sp.]|nr:50S ribosomal protein L23 [Methylobacter sp.]MDP2429256.1 50S ribosomal protein L23 [Methylobacter sp.]MDP3054169.1 50S ribosomal protein L23 [Methylobacter sp.]MDP3363020.1 50S ribosomal protein L23 [Methylobacter sp.]MDZ4220615.1 50S ribosomal protein L23 [Methylobacter sp.]
MSLNQYHLAGVLQAPIISEKSTVAAEKNNRFVFKVQKQATKKQVKSAVELMFKVEVDSVQVLNVKGKQKRFGGSLGQRSDWKKAYVKLKPGHDIDFAAA